MGQNGALDELGLPPATTSNEKVRNPFWEPPGTRADVPFRVIPEWVSLMSKTNGAAFSANDEAQPTVSDLSRYERTYRQLGDNGLRYFMLWQLSTAHAMLLEQAGDRTYPEFGGLNGRQLAEGARAQARFFAFMIAEPPSRTEDDLERKITVYEAMVFQEDEMERSHAAVMVETAMHVDARRLGINLRKLPIETGTTSRH